MLPYSCMSAKAPLGPIPFSPGTLSDVSPMSASTSGHCSKDTSINSDILQPG